MTFDCDMHHLTKMVDIFNAPYPMEFDDVFNNTVGAVLGYKVYDVMRERI